MTKHKGPICKECKRTFYYDYQPAGNDGTGLCPNCWADKLANRIHRQCDVIDQAFERAEQKCE